MLKVGETCVFPHTFIHRYMDVKKFGTTDISNDTFMILINADCIHVHEPKIRVCFRIYYY